MKRSRFFSMLVGAPIAAMMSKKVEPDYGWNVNPNPEWYEKEGAFIGTRLNKWHTYDEDGEKRDAYFWWDSNNSWIVLDLDDGWKTTRYVSDIV